MKANRKTTAIYLAQLMLVLLVGGVLPQIIMPPAVMAQQQNSGNSANGDPRDANPTNADSNRRRYYLRMKNGQVFSPEQYGGTDKLVPVDGGSGIGDRLSRGISALRNGQGLSGAVQAAAASQGSGPLKSDGPGTVKTQSGPTFMWPVPVPAGVASTVPTFRDEGINKNELKTFGYPVSDTQFQLIQRYNDNIMLEQMFDPEKLMWMMTSTAGLQSNSAANSAGNMATNQAISAIDFTKKYLVNFTAEQGNVWHRIRDQLFIPMAILLLLPGAVLAQVKAIIAQGSPVWANADSPLEGITRSIIAVFLIPGTFLVINYGIDVSNSITFTIADEYKRIFGTDMYEDAICHEKRAFPINPQNRNRNAIVDSEQLQQKGSTVWSAWEALNLNVREYDPCLGVDNTRVPDEDVKQAKNMGRLGYNMANAGITASWNIMCAFQMAYLYYLWCMGPIAAACWVWPIAPMRQALKSWIEGVVVLCFWSLFWNTVVLLIAAFKGVGDNGAIIVTALNSLANVAVKKAFDFAGLVAEGGAAAAGEMKKAMDGGGGGGGGSRGGSPGSPGSPGASTNPGSSLTNGTNVPGQGTGVIPGTGVNPDGTLALSAPGTGPNGSIDAASRVGVDANGNPLTNPDGTPITGDGVVDPGLPPGERTRMGDPNGVDAATAAGALAALGGPNGAPPSADEKAAIDQLRARSQQGDPASTAVLEALNRTQPGDMDKALAGDKDAQDRIRAATGLDANTLNQALRGDAGAMMTTAAIVGAAGGAAAAGDLVARAERGDAAARAQLESRTGVGADTLIRAAHGEKAAEMAVLARAGLDDKVREAAMRGDPTAQAAAQAAELTYARNSATGDFQQVAAFNEQTGQFEAIVPGSQTAEKPLGEFMRDSNGQALIAYDQATGTYRTQDGAGVTYDAQTGQWLARDANGSTNGGIVYDMNDKRFEAAGTGAPVEFQNGNFVAAGTNGNVVWDANENRFETRDGQVAMSDPGGSGEWYRVAQDGQSVEALRMDGQGQGTWQAVEPGRAPIEMQNGQIVAAGTNGNVIFDQTQGRYEARNVDAGVTYDKANNQWYAQGAGYQVAYDVNGAQFRATGTDQAVSYTGGNWTVDGTRGQVALDSAQGRFEAVGTNAAVSFNQQTGNWEAAAAQGQVVFDRQDGRFETPQGQVAIADPSGSGRWYQAAADGTVSMLAVAAAGQAASWTRTTPEHAPFTVNNGQVIANGSNGQVHFDQSAGRWEYRAPQGNGQFVDTNIQMARDASSGNWVAANTGGQVIYDPASRQLEVFGTNTAVQHDTSGNFYAAGTNGSVVLDTQTGQGARWEVRGTDTPVVQDTRSGQWIAADSRGAVVWDAQQQRFEQAGNNTPVFRDPGGQGWYAVAASGMVTTLSADARTGQPQWTSADPRSVPFQIDRASGTAYVPNSDGQPAFVYDKRDQRWEVAGTNQPIQYDSRSQQWVAPETYGRVAYDVADKRMEVLGPNGQLTNIPVVSDPSGGSYYAVSADGQMRQLDSSSGAWRQVGQDAGIAVIPAREQGGTPQIIATASMSPADRALIQSDPQRAAQAAQVVYDQGQNRWEVANNPNPAMNGTPIVSDGGKFYADGTGHQIAYDVSDRRFELAGSNQPVEYNRDVGSWVYQGTSQQVALRTADGAWTAGTLASPGQNQGQQIDAQAYAPRGYDPSLNPRPNGIDPALNPQAYSANYQGYVEQPRNLSGFVEHLQQPGFIDQTQQPGFVPQPQNFERQTYDSSVAYNPQEFRQGVDPRLPQDQNLRVDSPQIRPESPQYRDPGMRPESPQYRDPGMRPESPQYRDPGMRPESPQYNDPVVRHEPAGGRVSDWNVSSTPGSAHITGPGFHINADSSGHVDIHGPGYQAHADHTGGYVTPDTQIFDQQHRGTGSQSPPQPPPQPPQRQQYDVGSVWGHVARIGGAFGLGSAMRNMGNQQNRVNRAQQGPNPPPPPQPQRMKDSLQDQMQKKPGKKRKRREVYDDLTGEFLGYEEYME